MMDEEIRQLERRLRATGGLEQFIIEAFFNLEKEVRKRVLNEVRGIDLIQQEITYKGERIPLCKLPDSELVNFLNMRSRLGTLPSNNTILKFKTGHTLPLGSLKYAGYFLESLRRGLINDRMIIHKDSQQTIQTIE